MNTETVLLSSDQADQEALADQESTERIAPAEDMTSQQERIEEKLTLLDDNQQKRDDFSVEKGSGRKKGIRTRRCFCIALIIVLLLLVIAIIAAAATATVVYLTEKSSDTLHTVSLDDILNSSFQAKSYSAEWTRDNQLLHKSSSEGVQLYSPAENTTVTIISPEIMSQYKVSNVKLSPTGDYALLISNKEQVFRHSFIADYYVHNLDNGETWLLILPESDGGTNKVQYAVWSPADDKVAFVYSNNVYTYDVTTNASTQHTNNGENNKIYNGIPDWVYEEEVLSTDHALWWSPEGGYIVYLTFNDTRVETFQYPVYGPRTNPYTEIESIAYPKTGTTNPTVQASVLSVNNGSIQVLAPPLDNKYYVIYVVWANETTPMISWMNRTQNSMTYCLYETTGEGTECREIYTQNSEAWIEMVQAPVFTESGNKMLLIDSVPVEDDSFLHIVEIDTTSLVVKTLTHGAWEVTDILGSSGDSILYTSTRSSPWQRHIYRTSVEEDVCLTCDQQQWQERPYYTHAESQPSDCHYWRGLCSNDLSFCLLYCSGPTIPFTVLVEYTDEVFAIVSYLETNSELSELLSDYDLPTVEEIKVPAEEDTPELHARVMFPPGASKKCSNNYPMLFYVYGGPYSQMIGQYSVTSRMFLLWLSSNLNMIVISVDGRGTGFHGNKFKYAVYRRLGILETEDQIRAAKYFQNLCYTDDRKTAIYGSSYGGYMAGMVGASDSGVFSTAVSQSPVTDWIYYDTIYTERYMGLPTEQDNENGYKASSLLSRAGNLSSVDYLLIHGTGDDNVHFQNTAQLVEGLTSKGISFKLQFYTDQTHSLQETPRHLYELISNFLNDSFRMT